MFDWLRRLDDAIFSPPHKFETILALVVSQLGLVFEDGSDERADQGTPKKQETRRESRPS